MTWGKGGSTNVVQVTTKYHRAASVPAADVEYEPSVGPKTARAVYSAMNDANDLSLASRRQDQKLLNDIQIRMDNAAFIKPPRRESRPRSRSFYQRRTSVPAISSLPISGSRSLADEEFELVFPEKLSVKHLPPCARRAYHRGYLQRASSLPPSTDEIEARYSTAYRAPAMSGRRTSTAGGDFIGFGSPLLRVVDTGAPIKSSYYYTSPYVANTEAPLRPPNPAPVASYWWPYEVPRAKRRYSFAFEDPDEYRYHYDYTPQLNMAHAYAVTYPRPYVRRHVPFSLPPRHYNVYRFEGDYASAPITSGFRASSEPKRFMPSSSLAVRQARESLNRIERELGMGSVSVDDGPYFEEPVVRSTHIVPSTAVRTGWVRNSPRAARRTSYNYALTSSRPPPVPRSTRLHEIEARLETMLVPDSITSPVSLSSLRSRTSDARNKMDQHKILLDRYLPLPVGPPNEVPYEVEYKFSELAERMPQLRPREPIYRASSLPPPASPVTNRSGRTHLNQYNDALRSTPIRYTMSDTRKRAREVLCRTKGDPHYFDY